MKLRQSTSVPGSVFGKDWHRIAFSGFLWASSLALHGDRMMEYISMGMQIVITWPTLIAGLEARRQLKALKAANR